jgi:hypothetical protein
VQLPHHLGDSRVTHLHHHPLSIAWAISAVVTVTHLAVSLLNKQCGGGLFSRGSNCDEVNGSYITGGQERRTQSKGETMITCSTLSLSWLSLAIVAFQLAIVAFGPLSWLWSAGHDSEGNATIAKVPR